MDFRLVKIEEYVVLLERFNDDEQWQVYMSVYMDLENRYDEWFNFQTAREAQQCIADYPEVHVLEFLQRAKHWHETAAH